MVRVGTWFLRLIVSDGGEWSRGTSTFVVERLMGALKVDRMEVFSVNSKAIRELLGALRTTIVLYLVEDFGGRMDPLSMHLGAQIMQVSFPSPPPSYYIYTTLRYS